MSVGDWILVITFVVPMSIVGIMGIRLFVIDVTQRDLNNFLVSMFAAAIMMCFGLFTWIFWVAMTAWSP